MFVRNDDLLVLILCKGLGMGHFQNLGPSLTLTIMISPYGSNAPLLGPYPTPFT